MPKVNGKARPLLDAEGMSIKGKDNREQALACWHEIVAREKAIIRGLDNPLRLIFEEFLEHTQRHRETDTYVDYRRTLQNFKDKWPDLTVAELSQRHIEAWFDDHKDWSSTTRWNYLTILLAALNWAAKPTVKLIPFNPLRGLERPRRRSRAGEARVDEATHQLLMSKVPWDFKQILLALRHTGTRPSNICRVTAKNFDAEAGIWVFTEHNTAPGTSIHKTFKQTGQPLVVPLTRDLVELCKALAQKHPDGPLFRTRRGRPWTPNNIEKHFRLWRKKLKEEGHPMPERIYAYCYRHQMATELLERGESETLVAALLGHKGTRVLHQNYSGVTAKSKVVRELLLRNMRTLPAETSVSASKGATLPSAPAASAGVDEARPAPPLAEEVPAPTTPSPEERTDQKT
jgi:integrase